MTVLFADLVGYSVLAECMDPEELRGVLTETFAEFSAEVKRLDGRVEKFIGDAVVATFGAEKAHEDDPERAVLAALVMLRLAEARSLTVPAPLRLRVGINTGLVVAGAVGDGTQTGVLGDPVVVAARLQQAAEPGEILISASVLRRVRDRYCAIPVGPVEMKGRQRPVEAYRVVPGVPPLRRKRAPFVGRQEEIALLDLLWSSAVKGNMHVVSVVGEPGVGKSRLVSELARHSDALDANVVCTGDRAYGPFLDLIERILGRLPQDLDDLERLAGGVPGVDEEVLVPMAALLGLRGAPPVAGMADDLQRPQVFAGTWRFFEAALAKRPSLIVLDDLQAGDRSSLELLEFILERAGGLPLMLVLAYRSGFDHLARVPIRASHTEVRLSTLSPEESAMMARGYLAVPEIPTDLERLVAARAEGNPFFIEELLQALTEMGSLAVDEGRVLLRNRDAPIPETIEGTILARVDRLDSRERQVLQIASVIGPTFTTELVATLVSEPQIELVLDRLARTQLLARESSERWAFAHSLIREVVYGALLREQRRQLHGMVAEAMEAKAGSDDDVLGTLAEHYAQAGMRDKARPYALAAGDAARDRMALVEARDRYEIALSLWGEGDEPGRLELLSKLGWTALLAGDAASARTAMIEVEAGFRALGDVRRAGAALAALGRVHFFSGDIAQSQDALEQAVQNLRSGGPSVELVQAYVWASILYSVTGRTDRLAEVAVVGLELAESLAMEGAKAHLMVSLGASEVWKCNPEGLARIRKALDVAERSGDAEALGRAHLNVAVAEYELLRIESGLADCDRGMEAMRRLGALSFEHIIAGVRARMLVAAGHYEEAEAQARDLMADRGGPVGNPALVFAGVALITSLTRRGSLREARRQLDAILPVARQMGADMFLLPALTARAELEEAAGNMAAAAEAIGEAGHAALLSSSSAQLFASLPFAARLLPPYEVEALLERGRANATDPAFASRLQEAEGLVSGSPSQLLEAADLYGSLGLPYEEARCRLEGGDLGRAAELVGRFGLQDGPLGGRAVDPLLD